MSPSRRGWRPSYDDAGRSHRMRAARGAGSRRGFGRTWWGAAWVEALEDRARLDPNRLSRGRSYARSGAVGDLDVSAGEVVAHVQGRRPRPYQVRVRVRQFDGNEWERLLDTVAGRIGHSAALLDGELPPDVLDDVAAAGLHLLPGAGDLQPRCSCPDWADPCKHAAAVCYLVADTLDTDPFALLLLRGRAREQVLAGLRARRGAGAQAAVQEVVVDHGVPAGAAWRQPIRRALPTVPVPPVRPGRPAPLAADPPPGAGIDVAALAALAADAAARACALALGEGDGGLTLDRTADLARRAATMIGTVELDRLASAAGISGRALLRWALAWRYGGVDGLATLTTTSRPAADDLVEGRAALGPAARIWRNRVTSDDVQLRVGMDGRWYPYRRVAGDWDPVGPSSLDARDALAATTQEAPTGKSW